MPNQEEPIVLTPDQVATIRASQEDVKAGRIFTPDQVRQHMQAKHEA